MGTEHITRARRAKAVALATVLADCPSITAPADVHVLTPTAWELAAQAATARNLLGQGRTVHPPHSVETVAAVERELRMLQVEQRVDVEQPHTNAGRPDMHPEASASAGYREHMRRIKPMVTDDYTPDEATDAAFAMFGQADRR